MLIYNFVYIYLLLKPYYLFKSGTLQIADIFLISAFILLAIKAMREKDIFKELWKKSYLINIFLVCVVYISLIYSILYSRNDFLITAAYYVYNIFAIYIFYYCIKDKKVLLNIRKILEFNIIIQVVLYILKIGTWYGVIRYMGTFNDPNQFAFFIFSSLICIYIIEKALNEKKSYYTYIMAICLIIESSSTGVLLGTASMCIGLGIYKLIKNFKKYKIKIIIGTICFIAVVTSITCTNNKVKTIIINEYNENVITMRIKEKLNKIENIEGNLLEERGYDKITKYPYKILIGAGHGYSERFNTFHKGEIHATLPSILFYYGIVPFSILMIWIWKNIKKVPIQIYIVYFSLLIESLTLQNQRQPLFWLIIILGWIWNIEKVKEEEQYE